MWAIDWPAHPGEVEMRGEYERFWFQLGSRAIDDLVDLPPMQDSEALGTIDVLTRVEVPAWVTAQKRMAKGFSAVAGDWTIPVTSGPC